MTRTAVGIASTEKHEVESEVARLRGLDSEALRARWRTVFGRKAPPHLPRHLMFRMLAYRLQANRLGDLDQSLRRLLEQAADPGTTAPRLEAELRRVGPSLRPGTLLSREWEGHLQQVMVLADGFSWKGKTFKSLSAVAFAITGTRWNGPRFFGLRGRSEA
jgi:hypothetical protein